MADKNYNHIPKDKFAFVNEGERLSDQKFEDKPIGYFKDAWIRFRKSKASVVATIIIAMIIAYAFLAPVLIRSHDAKFMVNLYAKKPGRVAALSSLSAFDGGLVRDFSEKGLVTAVGIGVGAENWDGTPVSVGDSLKSEYQPMIKIGDPKITIGANKKEAKVFTGRIDSYLEVGFFYRSIKQSELQSILDWEEANGKKILYPLVADNEWNLDAANANNWFKTQKGNPVKVDANGNAKTLSYSEELVLEDNYKRDAEGNLIYWEYTGGGNIETAQLKVRVLYDT